MQFEVGGQCYAPIIISPVTAAAYPGEICRLSTLGALHEGAQRAASPPCLLKMCSVWKTTPAAHSVPQLLSFRQSAADQIDSMSKNPLSVCAPVFFNL